MREKLRRLRVPGRHGPGFVYGVSMGLNVVVIAHWTNSLPFPIAVAAAAVVGLVWVLVVTALYWSGYAIYLGLTHPSERRDRSSSRRGED